MRSIPNYQNCERWKALALLFNGDTDQALAAFERGVAGGFIVNRADSFVPLTAPARRPDGGAAADGRDGREA